MSSLGRNTTEKTQLSIHVFAYKNIKFEKIQSLDCKVEFTRTFFLLLFSFSPFGLFAHCTVKSIGYTYVLLFDILHNSHEWYTDQHFNKQIKKREKKRVNK